MSLPRKSRSRSLVAVVLGIEIPGNGDFMVPAGTQTPRRIGFLVNHNIPSPMFFVRVDSKRFRHSVSSLDATLTRYFISVDFKGFRDVGEWESGTRKLRGRTGQEATIVEEEKSRPGLQSINTEEDSTKVYYLSITFLIAFEWSRKKLKCWEVTGLRVGIEAMAIRKEGVEKSKARY